MFLINYVETNLKDDVKGKINARIAALISIAYATTAKVFKPAHVIYRACNCKER